MNHGKRKHPIFPEEEGKGEEEEKNQTVTTSGSIRAAEPLQEGMEESGLKPIVVTQRRHNGFGPILGD